MSELYENWAVSDKSGVITISASQRGVVNPALHVFVNKDTGAVVVKGCPELQALECNGEVHHCQITPYSCIVTDGGNNVRVPNRS